MENTGPTLQEVSVYDSRIPLRLTQKVMGALLYTIGSIIGKHVKVTYKK